MEVHVAAVKGRGISRMARIEPAAPNLDVGKPDAPEGISNDIAFKNGAAVRINLKGDKTSSGRGPGAASRAGEKPGTGRRRCAARRSPDPRFHCHQKRAYHGIAIER